MTKEIVIAAYDRDLSWTDKLSLVVKKSIYRKGTYRNDSEVFLDPNIGRCVHSFFTHIFRNYDNLSDMTFFTQDFPFDHWEDVIEVINNNSWEERVTLKLDGYYGFHYNSIGTMWQMPPSSQFKECGRTLVCLSNGMPQDHNPNINVDRYWDILFDCQKPLLYEFMPGGHFGITKEQVRLRSKQFYGKVIDLLESDVNAPWMIERLECYIFNPKNYKSKL